MITRIMSSTMFNREEKIKRYSGFFESPSALKIDA
jgi:hypothetical protein